MVFRGLVWGVGRGGVDCSDYAQAPGRRRRQAMLRGLPRRRIQASLKKSPGPSIPKTILKSKYFFFKNFFLPACRCVMLCGLPCGGKTTFALGLVRRLGPGRVAHLCQDELGRAECERAWGRETGGDKAGKRVRAGGRGEGGKRELRHVGLQPARRPSVPSVPRRRHARARPSGCEASLGATVWV